jgi:hypothetical protein
MKRYLDNPAERLQVLSWPRAVEPYVEKGELYNEAIFARLNDAFRGQTIEFSFWFN